MAGRIFKTIKEASKSVKVLQYNILADALSLSNPKENFCKVPKDCLEWSFRSTQLMKEISDYNADVLCLQEVDHFEDFFKPQLSNRGYDGVFSPKKDSPCLRIEDNTGPDGVAIFYRSEKFNLKGTHSKYLNEENGKEGKNPILLSVLEDIQTKHIIIIGVTHLKAKREFQERRKAQCESAVQAIKDIASNYENASIIFCGDFNGEPGEPFYEFLVKEQFVSSFAESIGKEPEYTTWKIRPSREEKHTIDYVWQCKKNALRVSGYLELMSDDCVPIQRFPSHEQPSDHIALCFEFALE